MGQQPTTKLQDRPGDRSTAFAELPDHEAAMVAMDLRRGMQALINITNESRGRDATIPVLSDLYLVRTALKMVIERVECREAAEL